MTDVPITISLQGTATLPDSNTDLGPRLTALESAIGALATRVAILEGTQEPGPDPTPPVSDEVGLGLHPAVATTDEADLAGATFGRCTGQLDDLHIVHATSNIPDNENGVESVANGGQSGFRIVLIDTAGDHKHRETGGSDSIRLDRSGVWIAGESAPGTVNFRHKPFRFNGSNQLLTHVGVFPGRYNYAGGKNDDDNTDALMFTAPSGQTVSHQLVLQCLIGGSLDEIAGIDGRSGTIRNSGILYSVLGMPLKGDRDHPFGIYCLDDTEGIVVAGNLVVDARRRMCGIEVGAELGAWGNIIVSPKAGFVTENPFHFEGKNSKFGPTIVDVGGNLLLWDPTDGRDGFVVDTLDGEREEIDAHIHRGSGDYTNNWVDEWGTIGEEEDDSPSNPPAVTNESDPTNVPAAAFWPKSDMFEKIVKHSGRMPLEKSGLHQTIITRAMAGGSESQWTDVPAEVHKSFPAFSVDEDWDSLGAGDIPVIFHQLNERNKTYDGVPYFTVAE